MADLITLSRAKFAIGGAQGAANLALHSDEQATVNALITAVTFAISKYCRRNFDEQTYEERYTGEGETKLLLRHFPIISVASITVDDVAVDAADYIIDAARGWLFRSCGWHSLDYGIEIEYDAGWSSVPEDIQEACAAWVAALYWQTKKNPFLMNTFSATTGNTYSALKENMPNHVKTILDPYRDRKI